MCVLEVSTMESHGNVHKKKATLGTNVPFTHRMGWLVIIVECLVVECGKLLWLRPTRIPKGKLHVHSKGNSHKSTIAKLCCIQSMPNSIRVMRGVAILVVNTTNKKEKKRKLT